MITLYLDMDGVLADFNKEYTKFDPQKEDRKKFRSAVIDHKIFEKLLMTHFKVILPKCRN